MSVWTENELVTIGNAEELHIASLRREGTFTNPTTIWVVRVVDRLFVRSVHGVTADWYRATQRTHEGHITAGGMTCDVTFTTADAASVDRVDAAYRTKYQRCALPSSTPRSPPTPTAPASNSSPAALASARTAVGQGSNETQRTSRTTARQSFSQ